MGNWISRGVFIGLSIESVLMVLMLMIPRGAIPATMVADYGYLSIYMRHWCGKKLTLKYNIIHFNPKMPDL